MFYKWESLQLTESQKCTRLIYKTIVVSIIEHYDRIKDVY